MQTLNADMRHPLSERMNERLRELCALSAVIGRDNALAQGAGGNTSCKINNTLWVKASGLLLEKAEESDIFVGVDLQTVRARVAEGRGDDLKGVVIAGDESLRPSIETTLHALLPHSVVLHVHSVRAIAACVRDDAETRLAEQLRGLRWRLVPYRRPGLPLTEAIAEATQSGDCDVFVLANHGLVVGGAECAEAAELLAEVERRLAPDATRPDFTADIDSLNTRAQGGAYRLPTNAACHAMAATAGATALASGGSLYPDHVVFLGPAVCVLADGDAMPSGDDAPALLLAPGKGVLVRQGISQGAEAMVHALAMVIRLLPDGASVRYLTAEDECQLLNWDAEKYRQALSARGGASCK